MFVSNGFMIRDSVLFFVSGVFPKGAVVSYELEHRVRSN